MALINATAIPDAADYELEQGLRFDRSSLGHLDWTPTTASTRKKWTFSFWVKPSMISSSDSNPVILAVSETNTRPSMSANLLAQASGNSFHIEQYNGSSYDYRIRCTADLRDPSAWYHIMVAFDTTQSTASNRLKTYINGEQITAFDLSVYPNQDHQTAVLNTVRHRIGNTSWTDDPSLGNQLSGYLAEVNMIDGQQLTPAHFGYSGTYGEWKPVEYGGTYGTNGFYLPFKQDYAVEGFSTVTWKGTGVNGNYIGGTGFKPDFTWIKQRSGVYSHVLADSVRGNGKFLSSANTGVEDPDITKFQNFATDGFTVGTHAGVNSSGQTYVAWNWDMGADTPTGFSAVTYKGSGSVRDVSGFGFSPDLVWIKSRDHTYGHHWTDSVRGAGKDLYSNTSDAEYSNANSLQVFKPDGFQLGTDNGVNNSTKNYVAWGWDMGDTTVTNTSGSLTSQVRANPTYGQSIVKYTGNTASSATVGHGLNSAPEFMIVRTTAANAWAVYHTSIGNTHLLEINTTAGKADNNEFWNDTSPTNSVFTIGSHNEVNHTQDYIAYCFHSVSGYSKFGSYTGNASTTGPSVTTGFRPAFLMVKKSSDTGSWLIVDATRNPLGLTTLRFNANTDGAEDSSADNNVEFTDNGFQIKTSSGGWNASGQSFIYMAFAGGMDSISDYNTDGTIDSRVKANSTYGQSIVSYEATGSAATVGHGLSSVPEMMIVKHRDQAGTSWIVYNHQMATSNSHHKYLKLNSDSALTDDINAWNDTAPTSSVFSIGPNGGDTNNSSGGSTIAYLWHSVSGYSSIGRYTGNGSATGPTITTGFRPAWIMIKPSTVVDHWNVYDTTRDPQNPINHLLFPNRDNAEGTGQDIEISDTGFQIKTNNTGSNQNGEYYIYMAFADKREYAYWLDQSGNNNDWTSNNLTESDISVDSPTNNFATLNSTDTANSLTLAEGNLNVTAGTGSVRATIPCSGKVYYEVVYAAGVGFGNNLTVGITNKTDAPASRDETGTYVLDFQRSGSTVWIYATSASNTDVASVTGMIGQIAFDNDTGKLWLGLNNSWVGGGNPATGSNPTATAPLGEYIPFMNSYADGGKLYFNFGQDSSFSGTKTAQGNQDSNDIGDFYYTPPTGFLALCTKNLPEPDVKPQEHFNTVTYTGTGLANNPQTVGFQPDFVWFKSRSAARAHVLVDAVRGVTKELVTNTTGAEQTSSATQDLTAFTSTGFTLGTPYNNSPNESGASIVAWNWKANGSGSSNTNGSITSTVSANVDAGFSIVSWTGNGSNATVGHGLSKTPELFIVKNRDDGTKNWATYYGEATRWLKLNATDASAPDAIWNNTAPTSSVFSLNSSVTANNSGDNIIAYCFHSVDGYSKVGTYTGNGNADGTFVYTGFRPAFVMVKSSSATGHWQIHDTTRDVSNLSVKRLFPNYSNAEDSSGAWDILSNGFKFRTTHSSINASGASQIYIAFAETPFKYSNAR